MTSGEELKQRNGLGGFARDFRLIVADYHQGAGRCHIGLTKPALDLRLVTADYLRSARAATLV